MARVLSISSQTIFGPVGNSVAVPALQSLGHTVLGLPTLLLTHHPGHGTPALHVTQNLGDHLARLHDMGELARLDAVATGYFATAEQVYFVAETISRLRGARPDLYVLVDPVMGDHGKLYVSEDVAIAIRDQLLPLADIATPNHFELSWLSQSDLSSTEAILAAAQGLNVKEVIVTSVPQGVDILSTLGLTADLTLAHHIKRQAHVPNGTGDLLAALYLGHRLNKPLQIAFTATMKTMERAILMSTTSNEIDLARTLFVT
jgi:pyridoxine kinase